MKPTVPKNLGVAGRSLWRAVVDEFDVSAAEQRLLLEACRTADELERLAGQLGEAEPFVAGSQGQPWPNPLFGEVREYRSTLAKLVAQLGVDAGDDEWRPSRRGQR